MVQTPTKKISLQEFLQQLDTKPASEFIDGEIFQKPMPKADHSIIQSDLTTAINLVLKKQQQARAVTELRCVFDERAIVPDITVLPGGDVPRQKNGKAAGEFLAAPPWMIEILSEGQRQIKVVRKIFHALEHGTQMGWLIDPEDECVFTYTPDLKMIPHADSDQPLPVPEFAKDFRLTANELFALLYE